MSTGHQAYLLSQGQDTDHQALSRYLLFHTWPGSFYVTFLEFSAIKVTGSTADQLLACVHFPLSDALVVGDAPFFWRPAGPGRQCCSSGPEPCARTRRRGRSRPGLPAPRCTGWTACGPSHPSVVDGQTEPVGPIRQVPIQQYILGNPHPPPTYIHTHHHSFIMITMIRSVRCQILTSRLRMIAKTNIVHETCIIIPLKDIKYKLQSCISLIY